MFRYFLRILFGPIGRITSIAFFVGMVWTLWSLMPQWPVEVVLDLSSNYWDRDFGTGVDFGYRGCNLSIDDDAQSRRFEQANSAWTVKFQDDQRLQIQEKGTKRILSILPPANYRWPSASRFGDRLSVEADGRAEIWDVVKGKRLYRGDDRGFLTPSGHYSWSLAEGTPNLAIFDNDQPNRKWNIDRAWKLSPWSRSDPAVFLDHIRWVAFSADDRWMAMEVWDNLPRSWLWVWNMDEGKPIWLIPLRRTDEIPFHGNPSFGSSNRYLAIVNEERQMLLDLSTDPPTDLSNVMAGFVQVDLEHQVYLTKTRAIVFGMLNETQMCRVIDLDNRRVIAQLDLAGSLVLTPDDRFGVIWEHQTPNRFATFVSQYMQPLCHWLVGNQCCYHVIDVESGRPCNYIKAEDLYQFDQRSTSVWARRHVPAGNTDQTIFERYPLRASGPPWWLWLLTGVGGLAMIREGRSWRRVNKVKACSAASLTS